MADRRCLARHLDVGLPVPHSQCAGRGGFPNLASAVAGAHPQSAAFALSYTWQRGVEGIEEYQATHAGLQNAQYQDSPFAPIIAGEGGIRRRHEGPNPQLDFPILQDLIDEGGTDYVAMPVRFSDGLINILTLPSDRPGGFSTQELGDLYEVLPALGRQLEAYA